MKRRYDIVIIGLGPAGATLARLLHSSFRVAAIDAKDDKKYHSGFHKPCGGLLAMDAQKALACFDLTLPKEILVHPQIFSVRTIDLDSHLEQHYQRFYINMDRHKFDLWMESMIGEKVTLFSDSYCKKIERTGDFYRIVFQYKGEEKTIFSRYVVGADGANSIVRRTFFPDKKPREYVSIQEWYQEENAKPFYSCIFDSKNTDCYSWSISKDGYFIFGGAYPKQGSRARFESQKKKLEKQGFSFGPVLKIEACMVLRPSGWKDFCTGADGVFLIGEAAGFISPSSLEGISGAINSAAILAKVLNKRKKNPNETYDKKTIWLRLKLVVKLWKCPFLYWPFLRWFVMKSGIGSIEKVNQDKGGFYV